jgi:hypothetical protein
VVCANSDFIVSDDRHFNILNNIDFPIINVMGIDTFKKTVSIT